jgi:hypothetical protein
MNIRRLLNTELSRINHPHRIGILLSNMRVFAESALQLYSIQNWGVVYGASEYLNTWMGTPPNYIQREM